MKLYRVESHFSEKTDRVPATLTVVELECKPENTVSHEESEDVYVDWFEDELKANKYLAECKAE